jgi:hypothetical protein
MKLSAFCANETALIAPALMPEIDPNSIASESTNWESAFRMPT